jgi:hypothetical protein
MIAQETRHSLVRSRVTALALVGALGIFAFADGVHSVHHLPDHDAASRCALAAASSNVQGVNLDHLPTVLPLLLCRIAREEQDPTAPVLQPVWAATGRSPPFSPT